jgi:hypothetical protein
MSNIPVTNCPLGLTNRICGDELPLPSAKLPSNTPLRSSVKRAVTVSVVWPADRFKDVLLRPIDPRAGAAVSEAVFVAIKLLLPSQAV